MADVVEHAVQMSGGDMCVRVDDPAVERIYPLDQWIEHRYSIDRTKVYRRKIIVVEDWTEVPRG